MDEELGAKAPVTRLRRRLSTEAEGTQSPLTPSTPTKKRVTRIAKPALELIDENVTETVPKKVTRKASTKDVEPMEEKPVTPSRRSTRVRSNTSLLLEATQNIVTDSPRAKRALRRNSQIGSDTETATTPARRTRTRKDSTSSVEKLGVTTSSNEKVVAQVAEAISEEPEKDISKDKLNISQNLTPVRKSPRLNKKDQKTADNSQKDEVDKPQQNDNALTKPSKLTEDDSSPSNGLTTIEEATTNTDVTDGKTKSKNSEIQNISLNSAKLIHEITIDPKKSTDFNKTESAIEESDNDKANRKRTKSWTTITAIDTSEHNNIPIKFASGDSIGEKEDTKYLNKSINKSVTIYNTSIENKENIHILKSVQDMSAGDTIKILEKTSCKDIQAVVFIEDSDSNSGSKKLSIDIHNDDEGGKNDGGDQCVPVVKQATPKRLTSESLVVEPMDIDETIPENVTIDDFSDKSNSSKEENQPDLKPNTSKRTSISLEQESTKSKRKSSITTTEEKNDFKDALSEKSHRKSSVTIPYENDKNLTEESNKSKRKSSLSKFDSDNDKRKSSTSSPIEKKNVSSNKSKRKSESETETQNPEKTFNENKSTLVLSQLKDLSTNETGNASKSPNDTNNDLSKSVNIPTTDTDKTNKSNYLTSTPLHQKPLQKLAIQINTSVITPDVEKKNTSKANRSKTSIKNVSNVSHDTDSSEDSDEDSREESKMIDDEAEEMSDDYQSGDSRDAEERQYEQDHEIIEKGETLESEADDSDDSDYEKDSFIVSSDEEDNDLLAGSGDDLSLTDNELKMTSKSKKKFDERKRKEQKSASREMYESRHQLKQSKKSKGNKIESSASESEEDEKAESQRKKKNRLRIDSSHDVGMNDSDADESVQVKKKKTKRLSESVCEDNPNEKEITIQNQSVVERNDPLAEAIKQEPKTPQKDFNMSTVLINDNIEQVQIDTNASVINPNETSDPLQATLVHEDAESDSDISENMEIKENYDSVLENLNKANKQNIKTGDTSLNLNKKPKNKLNDPIVDQLNLTQTKKSKKVTVPIAKDNAMEKSASKTEVSALEKKDDDDNSDTIDMHLLFPEDSNDSEANDNKFKPDEIKEPVDESIPLKRTEAKTNLRESIGEPEDTNINFFIDTKGAFEDMDISTQSSGKKNKKKPMQNLFVDNVDSNDCSAAPEETSANESLKKNKKKKRKNKSFEISQTEEEPIGNLLEVSSKYEQSNFESEETANSSLNNEKKKKKKNKSHDVAQIDEYAVSEETPNVSVNSEKKKKKKNKSQLNVSEIVENTAVEETPVNVSVNSEKKKKKHKSLDISQVIENEVSVETPIDVSVNSEKKKKKKNKSLELLHAFENTTTEEIIVNVSQNSEKKKKNKSLNAQEIEENPAPEETNDVPLKREKKKKKIKSLDASQSVDNTGDESDEAPLEIAYESRKKSENPEPVEDDGTLNNSKNKFKKKKKKNRKNLLQTDTITDQNEGNAKKRKHDQTSPTATDVADDEVQLLKIKKKKKLLQNDESGNSIQEGLTIKLNKRKATEDEIQRKSKVFKGNFFEKIHVSRLPDSIVNQLDEQPTFGESKSKKSKKTKGTAISTMPFVVEEGPRRKNKPSNFLEQSIYLNDYISPVQQKKKIKNPKVLPYIPTVVTSGEGYTSKFKINVLPQETQFIAQASNITNFRDEYLSKQRAKKLRVERFKKQRNNLAKF